jgi:hypothetical protein
LETFDIYGLVCILISMDSFFNNFLASFVH